MGQSAEVMREEGIDEMGRRGEKRGRGGSWVRTSVLVSVSYFDLASLNWLEKNQPSPRC